MDYNVTVTIRNGRILELMREHGIKSASELCRLAGVWPTTLGQLLAFKASPRKSSGEWTETAIKLSEYFGELPDYLFPDHMQHVLLSNRTEKLLTQAQIFSAIKQISQPTEEDMTTRKMINDIIASAELTPKEKEVIRQRYVLNNTLEGCGKANNVTGSRARQIEYRALRKLRRSAERLKVDADLVD